MWVAEGSLRAADFLVCIKGVGERRRAPGVHGRPGQGRGRNVCTVVVAADAADLGPEFRKLPRCFLGCGHERVMLL